MKKNQGISLISAVFFLVICGMLGAALISITRLEGKMRLSDLQAARAFQAASAGVEVAVARLSTSGSCPASDTFLLENSGFQVNLYCTVSSAFSEGNIAMNAYVIKSQGEYVDFNSADYSSRWLEVKVAI